jgi:hypothetical protein
MIEKPFEGIAGMVPSRRLVTSPIEIEASSSSAGPMMAPGWMVVSAIPFALAKAQAACSALVLPMQ